MHRKLVRIALCAAVAGSLALTATGCGSSEETTATETQRQSSPQVAAVAAGNVAEAKELYAAPRIPYERIEPVADSFGALDPKIDARENDVAAGEFEGFHRIEKALWEEGTTAGMAPVAEQLQRDVEALAGK